MEKTCQNRSDATPNLLGVQHRLTTQKPNIAWFLVDAAGLLDSWTASSILVGADSPLIRFI